MLYSCFGVSSEQYPSNIRLGEDVLKTSFVFVFRRHLQDFFKKRTSLRRLGHTSSEDVLIKTNYSRLSHSSSRHLQGVFKTYSKRFQDVLQKLLRSVFKTSCKDAFKTSLRRFQNISKMYYQVKLLLLTRLQDAFKTFSRRVQPILYYTF